MLAASIAAFVLLINKTKKYVKGKKCGRWGSVKAVLLGRGSREKVISSNAVLFVCVTDSTLR